MQTLAERLAWMRQVTNLTLRELSEKTGLSYSGLGMIERGMRVNIPVDTLQKITETYKIDPLWLMTGQGKQPSERALKEAVR